MTENIFRLLGRGVGYAFWLACVIASIGMAIELTDAKPGLGVALQENVSNGSANNRQ